MSELPNDIILISISISCPYTMKPCPMEEIKKLSKEVFEDRMEMIDNMSEEDKKNLVNEHKYCLYELEKPNKI